MRFKVIKAGFDGLCNSGETYETIDAALEQLQCHIGWRSLDELRYHVQQWAKDARPGDTFCSHASVVIAIGWPHEMDSLCCPMCKEGDAIKPDEFLMDVDGDVEQKTECEKCGCVWVDEFMLSGRKILNPKGKS